MTELSGIPAALAQVRRRIEQAAKRAGRDADQVTLVAVSKMQPPEAIRAALDGGQKVFGENYAQELRDKARDLATAAAQPEWHLIGPIQRNKIKYVVGTARLLHAIDRLEVATEIDRRAARLGLVQEILVEVNVAREPQKHGVEPDSTGDFTATLKGLGNLRCVGLMTLAPFCEDAEASRPHFRALGQLARTLGLAVLSMGTSQDFEVAVEEGATLVRVGSAIFGERIP